jgi:hypothetical protein
MKTRLAFLRETASFVLSMMLILALLGLVRDEYKNRGVDTSLIDPLID